VFRDASFGDDEGLAIREGEFDASDQPFGMRGHIDEEHAPRVDGPCLGFEEGFLGRVRANHPEGHDVGHVTP
jgi:hypothetical protein